MAILRMLLTDRRLWWAAAAVVAVAGIGGWAAWRAGVDLAVLEGWWQKLQEYLRAHPAALFFALVLLPALPVPATPLLFTAGLVWRDTPVVACAVCLLALSLNLTWTYWLAAGPARGFLQKWLARGTLKLPELPRGDHLMLILLVRLTPGVPFFAQNYVLGFVRPPFLLYLWVSLLCSGSLAIGVVLSAVGVGGGNLRWIILGVSIIVLGTVLTQLGRRRWGGS